uniref:Uncharacterized protein n=1 Tax=Sphaerodactylus townsendi TaxID=933632 RepID=A0ACB8FL61_9SAUR
MQNDLFLKFITFNIRCETFPTPKPALFLSPKQRRGGGGEENGGEMAEENQEITRNEMEEQNPAVSKQCHLPALNWRALAPCKLQPNRARDCFFECQGPPTLPKLNPFAARLKCQHPFPGGKILTAQVRLRSVIRG